MLPDVFFLNAAPTPLALDLLKRAHKSSGDELKVFIATDDWSQKAQPKAGAGSVNVYSLPSNCRSPYPGVNEGDRESIQFRVGEKATFNVVDDESFKKMQTKISIAFADILNFLNDNSIPTYFGAMPRAARPVNIKLSDGHAIVDEAKSLDVGVARIVLGYMERTFTADGRDLAADLGTYTKYNATFVADVLVVAAASLWADESCWESLSLAEKVTVETNGSYSGGGAEFGSGLSYCKPTFTRQASEERSVFKQFAAASVDRLKEALTEMCGEGGSEGTGALSSRLHWRRCTVWHDAFVNDVDDMPANALAIQAAQASGEDPLNLYGKQTSRSIHVGMKKTVCKKCLLVQSYVPSASGGAGCTGGGGRSPARPISTAAHASKHQGSSDERLHQAILSGRTEDALRLVAAVDVNTKNRRGQSALMLAASQRNEAVAVAILAHPSLEVLGYSNKKMNGSDYLAQV
jgi:hypothetical protein